jgi:hypothetical protein
MLTRNALLVLSFGCAPVTEQGLSGQDGSSGNDGQNCWDANGNGEADLAEDVNGDGIVDVADCQGADGQPGTDGQDCWDTDGDGQPDPEEDINGDGEVDVDDCQGGSSSDTADSGDTGEPSEDLGIFLGNLSIDQLEAAEYFCANYDRVYGSLSITEWEEDTLDAMSCLVEVTGDLEIEMRSEHYLSELVMPNLVRVGEELEVPLMNEATVVSFPVLEEAGRLWFDSVNECVVEELIFPALERVEGYFGIYDFFCIDRLEAPLLTEVGTFYISNVDDVDALTEFTSLTTVNDGFYIYYNQDLSDVSGLSALEYIGGDFNMAYNSSLSDSDAEALAESISYIGGSTNIYGNSGR